MYNLNWKQICSFNQKRKHLIKKRKGDNYEKI